MSVKCVVENSRCKYCGSTAREIEVTGDECLNPHLHPAQQKGEKMSTFEEWWTTTEFELGESPKSCAYRAWNAAIEHRGHPAASEDRGLREALECAEYALANPSSDQAFALNAVRTALQSVPSSPQPAIKLATYLLAKLPSHWQYDEVRTMAKEVVTAESSDTGQPEVWPGIQCLKFASAEDAKRAEKLFNDLTDEVERLRPPAASEERPFGQWTTFEQWWTDAGCKFNDPEIMAVQAFEEGQRQALQSVPSSPSLPYYCPHCKTALKDEHGWMVGTICYKCGKSVS